jgi:hypothetical protein
MTRILSIIFGITVLALVATGLTEASLAIGKHQTTSPEPVKPVVTIVKPKTAVTPVVTNTGTRSSGPTHRNRQRLCTYARGCHDLICHRYRPQRW